MAFGRRWTRRTAYLLQLCAVLALPACSDVRTTPDLPARSVYSQLGDIDLSPRTPLRPLAGGRPAEDLPPRAAAYMGRADPVMPAPEGGGAGPAGPAADATGALAAPGEDPNQGYQLSFENAPLPSVVKAVLGDTLGLSYEIDPRVQGNVSLSFGRALDRNQVLFALENALRMSNAALVKAATGYRVIPAPDAVGAAGVGGGRSAEPGYGLSVFPLRYVTASTMMKLLDGFATKPGSIRVDADRNLLLISGTGSEREAAMQTAQTFDADFMRGQSVGIYPLRNADPKAMIPELENIMHPGGDGQDQALLRFQPVDRLNAILVVTRRADLLAKAASWIARLDKTDTNATAIKVYRVRYGEAKHIADVLNSMFSGSSSLTDTTGQTAPGSGTQTSRVDALGALGGLGGGTGASGGSAGGGGFGTPAGTASVAGSAPGGAGSQPFGNLSTAAFGNQRNGTAGAGATSAEPELGQQGPTVAGVRVTADPVTNSLLIFASRDNYKTILRALQELDRPALQVAIEATIAEVTLNNNLSYGVQYFLRSQDVGLGRNQGSAGLSTNSVLNGVISKVLPGANLLLGPDTDPRIVLDALRQYTDVKVISSPSLVVLDNQVATLQVGDSVPVATSSATLVSAASNTSTTASVGFPVANTIDYRNTGVILRVLPRVNYNGNVSLDVEQEISSIVPSASADTLTPTVSERKIKSSIAVASEQTVLLAGLISDTQNSTRAGLPIIERIQGLGDLFSDNSRAHTRTELIIFIRPKIIRDGNDAADVAEALRDRILQSAPVAPRAPSRPLVRRN